MILFLKSSLKTIFKFLKWLSLSVLFLIVAAFLLLQTRPAQQLSGSLGAQWLRTKTGADISIDEAGINFQGQVRVRGLLIKDQNGDTLLSLRSLRCGIGIAAMFKRKFLIRHLAVTDATGFISRTETDSLFNYSFLLRPFLSAEPQKAAADTSAQAFDLLRAELRHIRLRYHDHYEGRILDLSLQELVAEGPGNDFSALRFPLKQLAVSGLNAEYRQLKASDQDTSSSMDALPEFSCRDLIIKNSQLSYYDRSAGITTGNYISDLGLKDIQLNLNTNLISASSFSLHHSWLSFAFMADSTQNRKESSQNPQENWIIRVNEIDLADNSIHYNHIGAPTKKGFDPAHINYNKVTLKAKGLLYSSPLIAADLEKFSFISEDGFRLNDLKAEILMSRRSLRIKNFDASTSRSKIHFDLVSRFSSLDSLVADPFHSDNDLVLSVPKLYGADLQYFIPDVQQHPFFSQAHNSSSLRVELRNNKETIQKAEIDLRTASATVLRASVRAVNIRHLKEATFTGSFSARTHSTDLTFLGLAGLLPPSFYIPDSLQLISRFQGSLKEFTSTTTVQSTAGTLSLNADLLAGDTWSILAHAGQFHLSRVMRAQLPSPLSLNLSAEGRGLNFETLSCRYQFSIGELFYRNYTYSAISGAGTYDAQQLHTGLLVRDPNLDLTLSSELSLKKGLESLKAELDVKGADLEKLKLIKTDHKLAFKAKADLRGFDVRSINGKADISSIIISHEGQKYLLDSLLFAAVNEKGRSELNMRSPIIALKYKGSFSPSDFTKELRLLLDDFSPFPLNAGIKKPEQVQNFELEIKLRHHPVLSEVIFPGLKEFVPGDIYASYDGTAKKLKLDAGIQHLHYHNAELHDFKVQVNSDSLRLNYKIGAKQLSNASIQFENFLVEGHAQDKSLFTRLSSTDDNKDKKLLLGTWLSAEGKRLRLSIDPAELYLMYEKWKVSPDNYLLFEGKNAYVHHLQLTKEGSAIEVSSEGNERTHIHLRLTNFDPGIFTRIIEKDSALLQGNMNGLLTIKSAGSGLGFLADLNVSDLKVRGIPTGQLQLKASNVQSDKFALEAVLSGEGNDVMLSGNFTSGKITSYDLEANLKNVSFKTIEAFSFGNIREASGDLNGRIRFAGTMKSPQIDGLLQFRNASFIPVLLQSRFYISDEKLMVKNDELQFSNFTVRDQFQQSASLSGKIKIDFGNPSFQLSMNSKNFQLINTGSRDNDTYYGRLIVDSRMNIRGSARFPVITAALKLREGSNFTFAVPERRITADKGEGVVLFVDSLKFHPIIRRSEAEEEKSQLRNYDISATIEADRRSTLRLIPDPTSGDSLVVRGDGALSFGLDPSGKMSLTGNYTIKEGIYQVSFQNVIRKKFDIESGSSIAWLGDLLDANVHINASHTIRTSAAELVSGQLSESEMGTFRRRYPFNIFLRMRGALLEPELSFEILQAAGDKGSGNNILNARLQQLNEDPSSLNKQVFALLVLNRFISENPLEAESGAAGATRATVGKFLSAQLNRLSSKFVKGVDLSFDVQSYEDHSSGRAAGRTELGVGLSKQLFNERLNVQVGGSFGVEGENTGGASSTNIGSDLTVEYKLSKDGRYRLKGFRNNQYAGVLEGQIIETGTGIIYVKDFDTWKNLFKAPNKKPFIQKESIADEKESD